VSIRGFLCLGFLCVFVVKPFAVVADLVTAEFDCLTARVLMEYRAMLLRRLGYRLSGGIIFLALSTALMAQNGTQVLTPVGYLDKANVHRIPPGYELTRMTDGHIRMANPTTGDYKDFPKPITAKVRPSFTDNGWITYLYWQNIFFKTHPISYFDTTWLVPPNPTTYNGQTLFQFNSIEPASQEAILQPVLQYGESAAGGGEYWGVASWYVEGNSGYVTSLVQVYPNESLTGIIKLTSRTRRGEIRSYSCQIFGIAGTTLTMHNIDELIWCTETLEVYGVNQCTDFPNTAYSQMYDINIQLKGAPVPPLAWTPVNVDTSCGVQSGINVNGSENGRITIYY
jgi:hypothetical protein